MQQSRRERKKQQTRERIVQAALELFAQQGYEQTTVNQIAAAADVDPKTFFNYFPTKDDVLFIEAKHNFDVLVAGIQRRTPEETPGEVLRRMVEEYAAYRRPLVPHREPEELSANARLVFSTPALQAKGLYLMLEAQQRIAAELMNVFPDELDPITAAAMTGALIGAIQQAGLASVQLGRTQDELWEASRHGLDIALHGVLSAAPRRTRTEAETS